MLLLVAARSGSASSVDSLILASQEASSDSQKIAILLEVANQVVESDPERASEVLKQAKRLLRKRPDERLEARLHLRYGRYYALSGRFHEATRSYDRAIHLAEAAGDTPVVESAVNNLAVLHMRLKNFDEGIAAFERLLHMAEARGDSEAVTGYLLNLGMACAEKGDSVRAERVLRRVLQRGVRNPFYRAVAANNLSYLNNSASRFREAERFARQALAAHPESTSVLLYVHASTNLGKALLGQRRFQEAKSVLDEVVRLAQEHGFEHELMEGLWNLASAYEGLGQYVRALRTLRRYSDGHDTLLTRENARQINELRVKYETEKKEQEIALREQQLRLAKTKFRFAVALFLMAAVSVVVVVNLYVKRTVAYRELVKRNLELVDSERRLSALDSYSTERPNGTKADTLPAGMSDKTRAKLVRELEQAFRQERVYLHPDLTLEKLAAQMGVSSRYLSQVIREYYRTSFPSLVNNLRVSEARRMLADEKYRHYSIEGIARTVGFSSKSAFNVAFKRITGLTPSFFRDSVRNVAKSVEHETA